MNKLAFNKDTHEYSLGDKKLISVTQLMRKHGLSPNYGDVPEEVLRAKAERGTLIHKEIEDYIKNDEIGFTNEMSAFKDYIENNGIDVLLSETMVYNDICAGTIDLVLYKDGVYSIADIKTTATLHKDAVSWQLSIYAYLYNLLHKEATTTEISKGYAYHFDKDGNLKVVEITLKPVAEVEKLFQCERDGQIYKQELNNVDYELIELAKVEALIAGIEQQKKAAEEQAIKLRSTLMEAMQSNGVKTFENDKIKLTLVDPATRTTIDSAKLKKELPEVAEKYSKTTTTKASLRITLKEDKQNDNA